MYWLKRHNYGPVELFNYNYVKVLEIEILGWHQFMMFYCRFPNCLGDLLESFIVITITIIVSVMVICINKQCIWINVLLEQKCSVTPLQRCIVAPTPLWMSLYILGVFSCTFCYSKFFVVLLHILRGVVL